MQYLKSSTLRDGTTSEKRHTTDLAEEVRCPLWVKSRHFVVQSFVRFTLESGTSDAMIGPGAHSQINLECGWFNVRFNRESRLSSC